MAKIKEFTGLRPKKELADLVAELPYDVVNTAEARIVAQKSEYNFYHISRSEVDLPDDINVYDKSVYNKARENLDRFINEGTLVYDQSENLYLYSLVMNGRMQTGLVACFNIEDYLNNIIKKHERVLDSKAEDRKNHIDTLDADTGLVFLFYKNEKKQQQLIEKAMEITPEYDFTSDDKVRHIFRIISDKNMIEDFKAAFKNNNFYIADGHHRAYSAVKVGLERKEKNKGHSGNENYNWFMAALFPHNELSIMPYNRVVVDLNSLSQEEFLEKLSQQYVISENDLSLERHTFRIYLDRWYKLIPKFKISDDAIASLDAQILQDTILDPILNIINPKNDKRIDFVGGIRGEEELVKLVNSGKFKVAFSLYPLVIDELIRVSDEDKLMPPKSTWFEPKLRSGLVIYRI
jgi:uncharacterized protein (DUF1015 family)